MYSNYLLWKYNNDAKTKSLVQPKGDLKITRRIKPICSEAKLDQQKIGKTL